MIEKVLSKTEADNAPLEDLLDVNEGMDVFGDRNDHELRPPGHPETVATDPNSTEIKMTRAQAMSIFA